MENLIIYKDRDMKVEIDQHFLQVYEKMFTNFFRLLESQHQLILGYIAEVLVCEGMAFPDTLIICSKNVYVLGKNSNIEIAKPFSIFNHGLEMISEQDNFLENLDIIKEKIIKYYGHEDFLCEFFDREFFGVRGYLCKIINEQAYILLFTYKEDE